MKEMETLIHTKFLIQL